MYYYLVVVPLANSPTYQQEEKQYLYLSHSLHRRPLLIFILNVRLLLSGVLE